MPSASTIAERESLNPAIARCVAAWQRTHDLLLAQHRGKDPFDAGAYFVRTQLAIAFRDAMPPLSGHDNICDFIACIAHAMLKQIFLPNECQLYLNAARVALAACRAKDRSEPKQKTAQV